ncbi:MAG: hypothetical protein DWI63_00245 [Chloroflexi bacterium]|nr:MAG: hypothetical protein DWI62_02150 [Chloroflexota bacterium]RLT47555.1 MAG: hypothetical protein DWI63_00245 [Chloroflexota bacterium]RLT51383.1 MAG: hypothetical protein DWI68_03885 [Chloroflexota bacterium]
MDFAVLSQFCFYGGLLSIPASIALWFYGAALVPNALDDIIDPAMRAAMMSAYRERWGIFVGLWPATLLILSSILKGM